MIIDLHSHSTASDGGLSPQALLERACAEGVDMFSITDHDTVAAYAELEVPRGLRLIPGIELSCVWSGVTVHVVGLGIDLDNPTLKAAEAQQVAARRQRAEVIGQRLTKKGFEGVYDRALAAAGERPLGRPDFARALVDMGGVASMNEAFDRYLGAGKIGDVKAMWPSLDTVVDWIVTSGGVAVLAHPLHYKMTATKLRGLISSFQAAGGRAMELSNGKPSADELRHLGRLCQQFGLEASVGSDFHHPSAWNELGRNSDVVGNLSPVWERWL